MSGTQKNERIGEAMATYRLTGEAVVTNRAYCGETKAVFEAPAADDEGNEYTAVWWDPDWSKANGEDFSGCCDWDSPDEYIER